MIGNYARCSAQIRVYEGGYVNHPRDPGGPTNMGITLAVLSGHRHRACTAADVQALTWDEASDIYRPQYWDSISGDKLPAGLDLAVFDRAVLSGPVMAAKLLQEALGQRVDGHIGAATIAAALSADPSRLIRDFEARADAFIRRLGTFAVFGDGWEARIAHVRAAGLAMVGKDVHLVHASPAVQAALVPEAAPYAVPETRGKAAPENVDLARTPIGQAHGLTLAGAAVAAVAAAGNAAGAFTELGTKLGGMTGIGGAFGHTVAVSASGCAVAGAVLACVAAMGRTSKGELSA